MDTGLRFQNALLRANQEASPDGILIVDENGKMISFNRRFVEMWGIPADVERSQSDERALRSVLSKLADPQGFLARVRHLYRHKNERSHDEIDLKDGRTFERHTSPIRGPEGRYYGRVWHFRDISRRCRAEKHLKESEERFRQLAESIRQVFWMLSSDFRKVVYISPSYEEIWGRSCTSLYLSPSSWIKTVHPDDHDRVQKILRPPIYKNFEMRYRIIRPDGAIRWIHDRAFPVRDKTGHIYRIAGVAEDITEHHKRETALRESEGRYRGVVDNIGTGVAVIDPGMRILSLNPKMKAWFPHIDLDRHQPLCYQSFNTPSRKKPCSYCPTILTLRDGSIHESVTETPTPKGIVNYRVVSSPIKDTEGRVTAAIEMVEDITEHRKAEEANALRKRDALQKEFIANISHEFRTPVTAIQGAAETLILGGLDDARNRLKFAKTIERHAARLKRLVENLLNLSSLESDEHRPLPEPIVLADCARDTVTGLSLLARRNAVATRIRIPRTIKVVADRTHVEQIFQNLYENAIKYNKRGGRILISAHRAPPNAAISIQDTGAGIHAKDLPHIFERFYRPRMRSARKLTGTGLGLPIVKQSVEANGGSLIVKSSPGKGSTFSFTLPLPKQSAV